METLLQEIEKALAAGLYYLAIVSALTLPNICAALAYPGGDTTRHDKDEYTKWFAQNLNYKYFTADDCYRLRCGVLHQGKFGHPKMQYDRVIFTIPQTGPRAHDSIMGPMVFVPELQSQPPPQGIVLIMDSVLFCREMISAVRTWFSKNRTNSDVQANLPFLVQFRPNGLSPYFHGNFPLIA